MAYRVRQIIIVFLLSVYLTRSSKEVELPEICPEFVTRQQWSARPPLKINYNVFPAKYVIVQHTVTPTCASITKCSSLLRKIQNVFMEENDCDDIGYNFLIGGDGRIYEGAGWHKQGAHTYGYNKNSIGLGFIGDFTDKLPTEKQLQGAKDFLQCAVDLGELETEYKLFAARQVRSTQSPGLRLYRKLQNFPGFAQNPPKKY